MNRNRPSLAAIGAVVAIAAGGMVVSTGPANAAPTGTAMVKTQRMSGPTLESKQHGWYAKGQKLTLVCYERGQLVSGYYSDKGRAGGPYADLWYKVSDGYFVMDIDVSTGTNDPVTPKCGDSGPSAGSTSGWQKPVDAAMTNGFGANPAFYKTIGLPNGHNGWDYPVPIGTKVRAVADGEVKASASEEMGGNVVRISHGDVVSGYAHLNRSLVKAGQKVTKGQVIGESGATGTGAYGAHLHFFVEPQSPNWQNGYAGSINPAPYFK